MNSINRLEESWSPSWDLGLQVEFNFADEAEEVAESVSLPSERANAWAMASKEVMNRQGVSSRHMNCGAASVGELIAFFESLGAEGASHE